MSDKSDIHFLVESKKCTVKVNNVNVICDKIRLWIYLNFNFLHFRKATFLVNRRSDLYSKFHLFPFKIHCIVYEQILNIKLKHMRRNGRWWQYLDKLYVLYGHCDSRNEMCGVLTVSRLPAACPVSPPPPGTARTAGSTPPPPRPRRCCPGTRRVNTGWTKKKGVLKKRKSAMVGVFWKKNPWPIR